MYPGTSIVHVQSFTPGNIRNRMSTVSSTVVSCTESSYLQAAGLHSWERELLRDCPTSALGDVRPFALSAVNVTVLGAGFELRDCS